MALDSMLFLFNIILFYLNFYLKENTLFRVNREKEKIYFCEVWGRKAALRMTRSRVDSFLSIFFVKFIHYTNYLYSL